MSRPNITAPGKTHTPTYTSADIQYRIFSRWAFWDVKLDIFTRSIVMHNHIQHIHPCQENIIIQSISFTQIPICFLTTRSAKEIPNAE